MKLAAATIAAKRHLAYARVLAKSFHRHHPDVPFFVLLADEVDGFFDPDREPFRLLRLDSLAIHDLDRLRFRYSQQELTYALTPSLLLHLLDSGFDGAAFLKQESLVTGDLAPILALLTRHAIVLTPHLTTPLAGDDAIEREINILLSGTFNVGFLGVSNTPAARAFLSWWRDRCATHAVHDVRNGMHFEQRWLDLVPAYFEDHHIIADEGFNVAHWNLPERRVSIDGERMTVNGSECRFVRFSGFDPERPDRVTRYSSRVAMDEIGDAAELFRRYAALLEAAGHDHVKDWPYAFDAFRDGSAVSYEARKTWRELGAELFADPWDPAYREWFDRYDRRNRGVRGLLTRAVRLWTTTRRASGMRAAVAAVGAAFWRRVGRRSLP